MDRQQYKIACAIVKQDCTMNGSLKDGKGNFCAIGGLYTAIDPDWAVDARLAKRSVFGIVAKTFSLDLGPIVQANDRWNTTSERRIHVLAALKRQLEV